MAKMEFYYIMVKGNFLNFEIKLNFNVKKILEY